MAGEQTGSLGKSAAERQTSGYLLEAILGDVDEAGAAVAAEWAARADSAEKALAASQTEAFKRASAEEQATLLCWAAGHGRLELLAGLLKAGVNPNSALTLHLPAFDFYAEREPTRAEMLAWAADIEDGEEGTVVLRAICPAVRNNQLEACRLLLEAGSDPNADSGTGVPILEAVSHGHTEVVQLLLAHGARTDAGSRTRSLLHLAGAYNYPQITRVLLDAGMDPNLPDSVGSGPLLAAVIRGDLASVRLLLAAGAVADPPERTADSITDPLLKMIHAKGKLNTTTPLIAASEGGHIEIVRELLNHKPDLSRTNNFNLTAYDAARRKNHLEVVRLLREAGAAGPGTARPVDLLTAAAAGDVAGIGTALANGIPIDTIGGVAPKQFDAEQALIDKAKAGGTKALTGMLLDLMNGGGDRRVAQALESHRNEMVQIPRECFGLTALMLAAKNGYVEAVRFLIERGANVMTRATDPFDRHQTALYFAARAGHVEIMRLLLDGGADPSAHGASVLGEPTGTPLHEATERGHAQAVRLLLERGARADAKMFDTTPLDVARRKGNQAIVELLEKAMG
ncbi:MAG TPA: ankyrin repeat domain-containing protein [Humisphaera sp.]|nr:ankyrin repeat domain-containing protein [Humisphaera sp.]